MKNRATITILFFILILSISTAGTIKVPSNKVTTEYGDSGAALSSNKMPMKTTLKFEVPYPQSSYEWFTTQAYNRPAPLSFGSGEHQISASVDLQGFAPLGANYSNYVKVKNPVVALTYVDPLIYGGALALFVDGLCGNFCTFATHTGMGIESKVTIEKGCKKKSKTFSWNDGKRTSCALYTSTLGNTYFYWTNDEEFDLAIVPDSSGRVNFNISLKNKILNYSCPLYYTDFWKFRSAGTQIATIYPNSTRDILQPNSSEIEVEIGWDRTNTAPTFENLVIALEGSQLKARLDFSDAENDTSICSYKWYFDGAQNGSGTRELTSSGTGLLVNSKTPPASFYDAKIVVECHEKTPSSFRDDITHLEAEYYTAEPTCSLNPSSATITAGTTKQFTVACTNTGTSCPSMNWVELVSGGGSISAGLFTAGASAGSGDVQAWGVYNSQRFTCTAPVTVTAVAIPACSITPNPATITTGATQQFTVACTNTGGSCPTITWAKTTGLGSLSPTTGTSTTLTVALTVPTENPGAVTASGTYNPTSFSCSASITVTTTPTIQIPNLLSATPNDGQVYVQWELRPNVTNYSYKVFWKSGSQAYANGRSRETDIIHVNEQPLNMTILSLTNGTQYCFRVQACNATDCSGFSNELCATPVAGTLQAPTLISATPGDEKVDLVWSPVSGALTHLVNIIPVVGTGVLPFGNVTSATITRGMYSTLSNGTEHCFRVQACNATSCSGFSNELCATPSAVTLTMDLAANPTSVNTGAASTITPTVGGTATGTATFSGQSCDTGGTATTPNASGIFNCTWTTTGEKIVSLTVTKDGLNVTATTGVDVGAASCILPWGGTLANNGTVTAYLTPTVPTGSTCTSQIRTCTNGTLSGSYTHQTCIVLSPPVSCSIIPASATFTGSSITFTATCTSGTCGTFTFSGTAGLTINSAGVLSDATSNGNITATMSLGGTCTAPVTYTSPVGDVWRVSVETDKDNYNVGDTMLIDSIVTKIGTNPASGIFTINIYNSITNDLVEEIKSENLNDGRTFTQLPYSIPDIPAGTYSVVAHMPTATGETKTTNNKATKLITIDSQQKNIVSTPEMDFPLIILIAFSIIFLARKKE